MREANPKVNPIKEYSIYNFLAKLSRIVVENESMTWSKALETHFSQNLFKSKSLRVSQNFIFRKFFCRWLEQYLQRQSNANLIAQREQL